ncbi:hypothetical protein WA158_002868 [Blastocystis sp. Blastoise]
MQLLYNSSKIIQKAFLLRRSALQCFSVLQKRTLFLNTSQDINTWPPTLQKQKCNELTSLKPNTQVTLSGWVESVRRLGSILFIVLRDNTGDIQLTFDTTQEFETLKKMTIESTICIRGPLTERPNDNVNMHMETGRFEVYPEEFHLLNKAEPLPFKPSDTTISEEISYQNRDISLREQYNQYILKYRAKLFTGIREQMNNHGFLEVDTPLLTKSTPEGAREFLVPVISQNHTCNYALSQSPQQYKQILMCGGVDRYYQLATCFRYEDGRKDRQMEFKQLDMEMSYVTDKKTIMNSVEMILSSVLSKVDKSFQNISFNTYTYDYVMKTFGTDKPDFKNPLQLEDITTCISSSTKYLDTKNPVIALCAPSLGSSFSMGLLKKKINSYIHQKDLYKHTETEGDVVFICEAKDYDAYLLLGKLRTDLYEEARTRNLLPKEPKYRDSLRFSWIVDFPLFEEQDGHLISCHHPFTSPSHSQMNLLQKPVPSDILKTIKSESFDLVLDGYEIGGGSLRIHNPSLQRYIFDQCLHIHNYEQKFSHLLSALSHGAPPHGGFALGVDRLLAILLHQPSIRSVIPFPKSLSGVDFITGAPTRMSKEEIKAFLEPFNNIKE